MVPVIAPDRPGNRKEFPMVWGFHIEGLEMPIINARVENAKDLSQCIESRDHVKVVTRHIWEPYMETCEDIRYTIGIKELYAKRKETIERLFGSA